MNEKNMLSIDNCVMTGEALDNCVPGTRGLSACDMHKMHVSTLLRVDGSFNLLSYAA